MTGGTQNRSIVQSLQVVCYNPGNLGDHKQYDQVIELWVSGFGFNARLHQHEEIEYKQGPTQYQGR